MDKAYAFLSRYFYAEWIAIVLITLALTLTLITIHIFNPKTSNFKEIEEKNFKEIRHMVNFLTENQCHYSESIDPVMVNEYYHPLKPATAFRVGFVENDILYTCKDNLKVKTRMLVSDLYSLEPMPSHS